MKKRMSFAMLESMRTDWKIFRLTGIAVAMLLSIAGCGGKEAILDVKQMTAKHVIKVDGKDYTVSQAKVYLANYQNLYGKVSGVDLWETDTNQELENYIKDMTISQMTKILGMDSLAREREMQLTDTEQKAAKKAAKAYYDSLGETEKDYLDISESELQQMYEDYSLAQKLYQSLAEEINAEVSDEEARIMEAMQIVVSEASTVKQIRKELKAGSDFATLASTYNEADTVKLQLARGSLPKEVEDAAFALEDGEVSQSIKTDQGYYFIYCLNKFNQELTDANKALIVQQREKEVFGDVYDAYIRKISRKIYQKNWDRVEINPSPDIDTDDFFQIYQEYCNSTG